jgi:plasmid stabilization system protein ParE
MIALRSSGAKLRWTREARRSFNKLVRFFKESFSDFRARGREIEESIEELRFAPLSCPVARVQEDLAFRKLVVKGRFVVYYLYIPPRKAEPQGVVWIRGVKHGAEQRPFLGVRECTVDELAMCMPGSRMPERQMARVPAHP